MGARIVPEPRLLRCPACGGVHVDRGRWARRPHKTHLCEHCGRTWRPGDGYTVGVAPDDPRLGAAGGHGPPGGPPERGREAGPTRWAQEGPARSRRSRGGS